VFEMKKFSKKGVLLFAGVMAVCAFALPAVSSAASWFPANDHSTLDSSNFGYTAPSAGGIVTSCTNSRFTTRVDNGDVLTITTGTFSGCTTVAAGIANTCLATLTGTNFPWRATATSTTSVTLTGVDIDLRFEHPAGGATCPALIGAQRRLTGTITGAYNRAAATITFTNAEGAVAHPGPTAVTFRGSLSTTGALTVID
jgi:hypothetical protein